MIAWLKTQKPVRRVDAPSESKDQGSVVTTLETGSILLAPVKKGEPIRLVWKEGDKGQSRPVPPGTWRVAHYAIEKTHQGALWILSGSGPNGPTVTVTAGRESKIEIDPRVHQEFTTLSAGERLTMALNLKGEHSMGLSILDASRDGIDRRVPVTYALLDANGKELSTGAMTYG